MLFHDIFQEPKTVYLEAFCDSIVDTFHLNVRISYKTQHELKRTDTSTSIFSEDSKLRVVVQGNWLSMLKGYNSTFRC